MRRFGGQNVANLMERFGVDDDIPIEAGIVSKSIENAQTKVEGHNFDIRKHLLKYDDVINQQREVIYAERRRILTSTSLKDSIWSMIEAHLSGLVQNFTVAEDAEDWDLPALYNAVRTITPLPASLTSNSWSNMEPDDIEAQVLDIAQKNYEQMETVLGEEVVRRHEKQLMLYIVSDLWVKHLTALDELRQGIGLRAFGQQDPLVAFQKDAFEMFGQLRDSIQEETVRRIYHPAIQVEAPRPQQLQAEHPDAIAASRMQADTPGATQKAPRPIRVEKTLGRNDLCYCGSGKKYKHCHMKSDMAGGNGKNAKAPAAQAKQGSGQQKRRARARKR